MAVLGLTTPSLTYRGLLLMISVSRAKTPSLSAWGVDVAAALSCTFGAACAAELLHASTSLLGNGVDVFEFLKLLFVAALVGVVHQSEGLVHALDVPNGRSATKEGFSKLSGE